MPSQRTLARLLVLHSWAGIVTALLLFIVCFSGAVVVFKHEIDLWANPSLALLPRAERPASLDTVLAQLQARYPQGRVDTIALPDGVSPNYYAFVRAPGAPGQPRLKLALRSDTGAVAGPVDSQLGQYLRMLHVFLFFGPRWIVGFLGVAMLVLIGTGFVIHRKIVAELFTQRWGRSLRVVASDLHKSVGIWCLGFHLLIAATGAWMGLAPLLEQGWRYLGSGAAQAEPPVATAPASTTAAMQSLDALHARAVQAVPGLRVQFVSLQHWGTPQATAAFTGGIDGHLASTARVQAQGATGALTTVFDPRREGFWPLVDSVMEPLHFGDFGGLALKWLYFLLGMTPALLSLTGTLIWLDGRRQRQPKPRPQAQPATPHARPAP